ncbi:MAG TPA: hypothetical protein VGH74_19640 [Planctomycetaceae bacterium]
MYHVKLTDDKWEILNDAGRMVFVGNKHQVESWLDSQDNLARQLAPSLSLASMLRAHLAKASRWLRGCCTRTSKMPRNGVCHN